MAKKVIMTGMVVNEFNEPMQAVAVFESNENGRLIGTGTTTDENGNFRGTFQEPGFVTFRFLGYDQVIQDVSSAYQVIQMKPAAFNLPPVNITPGTPAPAKKSFLPLILGLFGVYYFFGRK